MSLSEKGMLYLARAKTNTLDKFYTNPDVVDSCLATINLSEYDLAIEPSAGDGAFYNKLMIEKVGIDIAPETNNLLRMDYLHAAGLLQSIFELEMADNKKILVIGNPPFGKNSSLAVKFFNHSAKFCDTVAFIVPQTFRKISIQNRLNLNFHLKIERELPKSSFHLPNGESYSVPCLWQVWERKPLKREKIKMPLTHEDFAFVDKKEEANFLVQRVGVSAGATHKDFNRSESSHYLIKAPDCVYNIMKKIDWTETSKYHTAGNPSISKAELIEQYITAKIRDTNGAQKKHP